MSETKSATFVTSLVTRTVIQVDPKLWKSVSDAIRQGNVSQLPIEERFLQELIAAHILVSVDENELDTVINRSIAARAVSTTFGLVIVPTMSCSMNCHYCFEDKSDPKFLSDETIEALCVYVEEQLADDNFTSLHVRWFGGEPLNLPALIEKVMLRLKKVCISLGRSISGDIVTNGYGLTGERAARLAKLGLTSAQITFDGDKRQHDKIRRVASGGSYERLVENIISSSKYLAIRIRIHVAPYNRDGVPKLLEDFHDRGFHHFVSYIYFAPLFNYDQGAKSDAFQEDRRLFLSAYDFSVDVVGLSRIALELGFKLADPLDADYSVCTALREYTAVLNPDGSLAKCYMDAGDESEAYGTLGEGLTAPKNVAKWRNMGFFNDPECRNCNYSPICLGGCAKEVMMGADKSTICTPLRYNLHEMIPLHYMD